MKTECSHESKDGQGSAGSSSGVRRKLSFSLYGKLGHERRMETLELRKRTGVQKKYKKKVSLAEKV